MRRLALLLCVLTAPAWALVSIVQDAPQHGAAGYVGPGDIQSTWDAWYGLRAFSSATRGNALGNICLEDGTTCADVTTDATTGQPPNAPVISGTTCNNSTHICQVKLLYNKHGGSGAGDIGTGTSATRPTWVVSCIGSLPCMATTATQNLETAGSIFTDTQPDTVYSISNRTGNTTTTSTPICSGINTQLAYNNAVNQVIVYAGSVGGPVTASDNAFHGIQGLFNGSSSAITVDSSTTTGLSASTGAPSGKAIVAKSSCNTFIGQIVEVGIAPGSISDITGNAKTFWGY